MRLQLLALLLPLLAVLACGTPMPMNAGTDLPAGSVDMGAGSDAQVADPQRPPVGSTAALEEWLAAKRYNAWACEKDPHPPRAGSAHPANRICSNDLLSQSASGEYPVGSASVKELYDGSGKIYGYAVGLRTQAGAADSAWFWYERIGTTVYGNAPGVPLCANCHRGALRDNVFTQVTR